jgi:hypothetical protein
MKKELAKVTSSHDINEFSEIIVVVEYKTNVEGENIIQEMQKDVYKIEEVTPVSRYTITHYRYKEDKLKIEQSGIGTEEGLIEAIQQELDLEGNPINDNS